MSNREENRDSSQGWELAQQQSGQLAGDMPQLPQQGTSSTEEMQSGELHQQDEEIRVLRKAQPEIREIRKPDDVQKKSIPPGSRIRRLTPIETERLQAYPDNWTKFGVMNGKVVEISDSQRYKMCGNSLTTSVVVEIVKRLYA